MEITAEVGLGSATVDRFRAIDPDLIMAAEAQHDGAGTRHDRSEREILGTRV